MIQSHSGKQKAGMLALSALLQSTPTFLVSKASFPELLMHFSECMDVDLNAIWSILNTGAGQARTHSGI